MASNTNAKLKSLLKCSVCREVLSDPQTLACFHSFCHKCIDQLMKTKSKDESEIKCPECRALTDRNDLKSNFLVKELLDMYTSSSKGEDVTCEQCLEHKPEWKCVDCKMTLCKKCRNNHLRVPLLRGHRVLTLDADTEMIVDRLVFCTKHTSEPIKFNCKDCEIPLCIECKVTQHESHKTETIKDTLDRILPEMEKQLEKVKEHIADIKEKKEEINTRKEEIKEAFKHCRNENEKQLNKIINKAKEHYAALNKALDMKEDEEVTKLDQLFDREKEYQQIIKWVETCRESSKGVTLMGEIQTGLFGKVKEIANIPRLNKSRLKIDFPTYKFNDAQEKMENITGTVGYKPQKALMYPAVIMDGKNLDVPFKELFGKQWVQEKQIGLSNRCTRMAFVNGDIWLPIPAYNKIQVIDTDGNAVTDVQCTSVPRAVRQTPDGEIIMASDTGLFILNEDGSQSSQITGQNGNFCDVSIYEDKMFAVQYGQNTLPIYSRNEQSQWAYTGTLPLQYSCNHCEDTITHRKETFVTVKNYYANLFTAYNENNQYYKNASSPYSMSTPFLCGIDNSDSILFADCNNNRFQLYHTDGQCEIMNISGLCQPLDFLYDDTNETLWILNGTNQLVKYNCKP